MQTQNVLCVPDYSSNLLSVSRCTEWGHSFTFEKVNSCMKLHKGNRVKLTQENNLFYLPRSVLELKMSSNSVKLDSARKWHRRLGHLNQADVVKNAPETVGGTRWCMQCVGIGQDHKDSITKSGRDPSRSKAGEGVHRRVWTFQSRFTGFLVSYSALCLKPSTRSLCLWTCLRQRVKHSPAWSNLFSVWGRPRSWGRTMRRSFFQSSSRHSA